MRIVSTLLAALFLGALGFAEDKKEADKPLMGAYKRTSGEHTLTFTFKKDGKLDYLVAIGEASGTLECKYTKEKDGTVKCEVENFVKKGDFPVTKEKGYKFSFKAEAKKTAIAVSEFTGDEVNDDAKKILEGDYEAVAK